MGRFTIIIAVITSVLTTLITVGSMRVWFEQSNSVTSVNSMQNDSKIVDASLHSYESLVVKAVEKANPAVVAIIISKELPVYEPYGADSFFHPFGTFFRWRQEGVEEQQIGGGSGFFVSPNGYVVTNQHVISDADAEYTVLLNDGRSMEARIVAEDPVLDLAILKVEGDDFPYLPFGDSETLQVGQTVIAIGNALAEFENTVSLGIVSGLSRSIIASDVEGNAESLDQLIQTDAAINQGNSGGPLLNLKGEVVGVNVAMASGAENIGFAISGNSVKQAFASVEASGKITRPYIGIRYIPINREIQNQLSLQVEYGILVQSSSPTEPAVMPYSPAAKAGIKENDILLEIDGTRITEDTSFAGLIRRKSVGDTVTLKLLRDSEEKTVSVVLEEMPQ